MHIPDGFIDIPTSVAFAGIAAAGVAISLKGAKSSLDEKTAPLAGLTATFIERAFTRRSACCSSRRSLGSFTGADRCLTYASLALC